MGEDVELHRAGGAISPYLPPSTTFADLLFDSSSIEQVALRFHTARQFGALRTYLLRKLDTFDDSQKAQQTLLCTWITQVAPPLPSASPLALSSPRPPQLSSRLLKPPSGARAAPTLTASSRVRSRDALTDLLAHPA